MKAPVSEHADLLTTALLHPRLTSGWSGSQWTEVFRQARFTGLSGRLASQFLGLWEGAERSIQLPMALKGHLEAALRVCEAQREEVLREARHIDQALAGLGAPVVLLKGAAYAVAGLPAARGRVFSDIDILVPKASLPQAESLLTMHGWMTTEESDYNQQYYRQWMHELPPMRHLQRGTVLDVHHTILPETARLKPDAAQLLAHAQPLSAFKTLHVLSPVDMALHSMTHLFMNDDVSHALRDLSDLLLLMQDWPPESEHGRRLASRARELDLSRPLHYAVQQLERVFAFKLAQGAWSSKHAAAPGPLVGRLMDWVWLQALKVPVGEEPSAQQQLALGALYVRGHWLRMPPAMLARHLSIKALGLHKNESSKREAEVAKPQP